ncbi:hypothetical protein H4582DRAFT_1041073 [Lactarius indigo]|nr:hypothetical protein H4582DRAFT_1041073 [Lactarius indigo]
MLHHRSTYSGPPTIAGLHWSSQCRVMLRPTVLVNNSIPLPTHHVSPVKSSSLMRRRLFSTTEYSESRRRYPRPSSPSSRLALQSQLRAPFHQLLHQRATYWSSKATGRKWAMTPRCSCPYIMPLTPSPPSSRAGALILSRSFWVLVLSHCFNGVLSGNLGVIRSRSWSSRTRQTSPAGFSLLPMAFHW